VIRPLLACSLALAALCAVETLPVHQGTVVLADRSFAGVWISSETIENLVHTLDSNRTSPPTTLQHNRYLRVDYVRPNDVAWLRGEAFAAKGAWAEAAAQYLEASKKASSWYIREYGFLRAAEAFVLTGKPDDAISALDGLLAVNPKSVQQPRISYLRGEALHKKGDAAGAMKAFTELTKHSDWGVDATSLGALGQGELLAADGKHDEAAKALAAAFAVLDPVKNSELFGQIGVALAASQQAAGQTNPAIATLRRLAYGAADATTRARAQLAWAKLLAGSDATIFEAYDHAVMAMHVRDASGPVTDQAAQFARQLSGRIDKLPDAQASSELKAEYRRYLSR